MERKIIYEPHPVSPERKAELVAAGYKIIDAVFAPEGEEPAEPAKVEEPAEPAKVEEPAEPAKAPAKGAAAKKADD